MSRPLRLEYPGALWHVTCRGNERRDIFRDDTDRHFFVDLLGKTVNYACWILHAWVLMRNHYHLLIETPITTLSKGVKKLNQQYAQWFNWRHDRVGHLFQGRFKGILVEREAHLLELIRYVVLNPVRCGAVNDAGDYVWSNYGETAGLRDSQPWLEIDWTLNQFHRNRHIAQRDYERFVAAGTTSSYKPWEQLAGQMFLGGEEFCNRMQLRLSEANRSREHRKDQRKLVYRNFSKAIKLACREFRLAEEDLRKKNRGPARKAVASLGRIDCGLGLRTIGDWLQVSDWAVSKLVRASQELEGQDSTYRTSLERIRAALS